MAYLSPRALVFALGSIVLPVPLSLRVPGVIVGAGLAVAIWRSRAALPKSQTKTGYRMAVAVFAGVCLGLLLGLTAFPHRSAELSPAKGPAPSLITGFIAGLLTAGVYEEPLFRGFLWGRLRKASWEEKGVWLVQAGLFWVSHLYYAITEPYSFWISVPMAGLVLGLLAWRSRSIAWAMVAHAVANSVWQIVVYHLS